LYRESLDVMMARGWRREQMAAETEHGRMGEKVRERVHGRVREKTHERKHLA
jgi:hypothetical protein